LAFTTTELISMFNAEFRGTRADYLALKNHFAAENESGCLLT
jgi:hypothetical protein